jgi:hypothetical protein
MVSSASCEQAASRLGMLAFRGELRDALAQGAERVRFGLGHA